MDQAKGSRHIVEVECSGCQYEETKELSTWEIEFQHVWCPKCSRKLWLTPPEADEPSVGDDT